MNKKVALSLLSATVFASMAASAFAAPKSGVYMGGDVDRYYALTDLFKLNDAGYAKFQSDLAKTKFENLIFVDHDGKGASLKEILSSTQDFEKIKRDLKQSDFEGEYAKSNLDGTNGESYDPRKDITAEPVGELKVESVSAINAKQIEVTFNSNVDEDTFDVRKFSIKRAGAAAVAFATTGATQVDAEVNGKTVTFTFVNALTSATWGSIAEGDTFLFAVSGHDGIEDASKSIVYSDKVAPALVSAKAKTASVTKGVTLTFNEPVDFATTGVFKVNGQVATPAGTTNAREVALTTAQTLTAGQTYTVEVTNLKDLSGNLISPNPVTLSFTVEQDNTAQSVKSVTVKGDDTVEIEFNESMDFNTIVGAVSGSSNVKLVDGLSNNITGATIARKGGTSTTTYVLTLAAGSNVFASSNTANLSLIITPAVKDAYGNAVAAETKTITLTKDTVAPTVNSASVVKAGGSYDGNTYANGALVVNLSEEVKAPAGGNLARTNLSVIDQDGTDITNTLYTAATIGSVALKSDDSKVVIIPFAATAPATTKTATVRVAAGAFTDASLGANTSVANVLSGVSFENATGGTGDTTKPVVQNAAGNTGAGNVLSVTFDVLEDNFDKASAQVLDNYRLDGKPLPAGTWVTISTNTATTPDTHTVTLNLPAESISETRANYAFTVSGIKDKAGNTANVFAVNNIFLTDNVKPVFNSATLNTDGTVSLGFSENLQAAAATDPVVGDLKVTLNGKELTATGTPAYSLTAITSGAEAGKYTLKVATSYYNGGDADSTGNEVLYIDVNANGAYDAAADITLSTGTYSAADAGDYNLNLASSLKVATVASPVTGADAAGNVLKGDVVITVK